MAGIGSSGPSSRTVTAGETEDDARGGGIEGKSLGNLAARRYTFRMLSRPTSADDRGAQVPVFRPVRAGVAGDDAALAAVAGLIRAGWIARSDGRFSREQALMILPGVMVGAAMFLPDMLGVRFSGWAWLVVFALFMALWTPFFFRYLQKRRAGMIFQTLLSHGRCGSCGYVLAQVPPARDGCVVCPECGGAWRQDRLGAREGSDPAAAPGESRPGRGFLRALADRFPLSDAQDRIVGAIDPMLHEISPQKLSALGPERVDRARRAVRQGTLRARYLQALAALVGAAVFLTPIVMVEIAMNRAAPALGPSASAPPVFLIATLGSVLPFLLFFLWRVRTCRTRSLGSIAARALVHQQICPSCAGDLERAPPDAAGRRACPACGAVWAPGRAVATDML